MSDYYSDSYDPSSVERDTRAIIREELEGLEAGESGISEEQARAIIEEMLAESGGGGTGGIDPERLDAIDRAIARLQESVDSFERKNGMRGVTWNAGPETIPADAVMHSTPLWGPSFTTERPLTLGDTRMRALQAGTVTLRAYEWSGATGSLGSVLAEKVVKFEGGAQTKTVHLDFEIPAGKRVLLTRPCPTTKANAPAAYQSLPSQAFKSSDDETSLAMVPYDARPDSKNGVTYHGKGHPIFTGNAVQYWHYFFGLEMTADVPQTDGV